MEVIGAPTGGAGTQTRHRAIGLGQIPREVFAAQRLLDRHLTSSSEHLGHGPLLNLDRMAIINYGRYPTVVPNFSLHAKRGDDGVYRLVEHRAGAFPRINLETAQRAHECSCGGTYVRDATRIHHAPSQVRYRSGIDVSREDSWDLGDDRTHGKYQVISQMRAGRVPTGATELDRDLVGGRGDGARAQTDGAHIEAWFAVHREDLAHTFQAAGRNYVDRSPGLLLLGRLKD